VPTLLALLIIFPLAGALFQVLLGRTVSRRTAELIACASIAASLLMATAAFPGRNPTGLYPLYRWISLEGFRAAVDIRYDSLAAVMALMVTFVSSLITIYSVSFMRDDTDYVRFFCYLNLFVFFMLVIVLADNFVFLFLGWEGVGFCSYALIGFWYEDEANATAGRKAFLLTRIGDVGFAAGMALLFSACGTLSISAINTGAHTLSAGAALAVGLLFFWAATGKSAQLPLLVWLPDAMAGPTPVSALIHAATMVTAGVYLLVRLFPLFSIVPEVLRLIALFGSLTALYGACAALVQTDIKRVLAYSTISQVGYMFLGIGAGDIIGSIFHLLTHAFFKSLLFLAAGCIIYALHGGHNILRMGGELRRRMPAVFLLFLAGALALGGVPPASGYVSKGRILLAALHPDSVFFICVWTCATLTAFLTTLYTFRLVFLVFSGNSEEAEIPSLRLPPKKLTATLWPLALLALVAGLGDLGQDSGWVASLLSALPGSTHESGSPSSLRRIVEYGDLFLALAGIGAAYFLYGPKNLFHLRSEKPFGVLPTEILRSGFGLDRLYAFAIVRPYTRAADFFWRIVDESALDNTILYTARVFPLVALVIRSWTTGRLTTSLKMLMAGFTVVLVFLLFR